MKGRKLRKDCVSAPLQEVLKNVDLDARIASVRKYLVRLGASGPNPPFFVNGIPLPMSDEWLQEMSQRVSTDLRTVQKAVFEEELNDESYVPEIFLSRASARRNPMGIVGLGVVVGFLRSVLFWIKVWFVCSLSLEKASDGDSVH
ncbi:hypothetical protein E1952_14905 [Staphylococcus aureus]|nr:hypothetical protein E1952_14905 [Staphylococcus aureus]